MRAGRLRDKITFQTQTTTTDIYGEAVVTWSDFVTRRAGVMPFKSNEFDRFDQIQVETRTTFQVRYLDGIVNSMRIVLEGRYFDIQSIVDVDNRHRELLITALERTYDES